MFYGCQVANAVYVASCLIGIATDVDFELHVVAGVGHEVDVDFQHGIGAGFHVLVLLALLMSRDTRSTRDITFSRQRLSFGHGDL